MPKFKYVGPHDAVEIDGVGVVENGGTFEVDADLGKSLAAQSDNYQSVAATKSKES